MAQRVKVILEDDIDGNWPCPLRARSASHLEYPTVTSGQPGTRSELWLRSSRRPGQRPPKPLISLAGCPFRAENRGRSLSADADDCLTAEIVSKPGAGSRSRAVQCRFEHED
jgi:hypothetical protein